MGTNIVETIQSRLESMGMSQAQFAECVSATPAQMSIFLREKGTLSIEALNKSLDLVGINLSVYSKRNDLAKEVASFLGEPAPYEIERKFLIESFPDEIDLNKYPTISNVINVYRSTGVGLAGTTDSERDPVMMSQLQMFNFGNKNFAND